MRIWNWLCESIEYLWRLATDREVLCAECGRSCGYVVRSGHRDWLCEECSPTKEVVAVNWVSESIN